METETLKIIQRINLWYLEDFAGNLLGRFPTQKAAEKQCTAMGYNFRVVPK